MLTTGKQKLGLKDRSGGNEMQVETNKQTNKQRVWPLITKEGIQEGSDRQDQRKTEHEQTKLEKQGNNITA